MDYNWTIALDVPAVSISDGPSVYSNSATATFVITTSGINLNCRLDNQEYSNCSSPRTLNALPEGPHTFYVRATDQVGAQPVQASYSWIIDLTAPTYTNPSPPSSAEVSPMIIIPVLDSLSGINPASLQCTRNSITVPCSLNGNSVVIAFSNLQDGEHSVRILISDRAGNPTLTNPIVWTKQTQVSIRLAWDANTESDLLGYRIYYGTQPGIFLQSPGQGILAAVSPSPSHMVGNLSRGQTYYFSVRAFNSAGEGPTSNTVQGQVP